LKKLLLLLPFLFSFSAKSQTSVYHPFPDSNATWCREYYFGDGTFCTEGSTSIYMNGDTLIETTLYHRLLTYDETRTYLCFSWSFWGANAFTATYYIRQDTAIKKVWLYDASINADVTFYDFNIQLGDTLDTSQVWWAAQGPWPPAVITSIDSVLIDGQYRTRYNYGNVSTFLERDTSIIEGIGGMSGLMNPPMGFESGSHMYLFTQNSQTLYLDTMGWQPSLACYDFTSEIIETSANSGLSVFPNPFHSTTTIQLPHSFSKSTLKIYNTLGSLVNEQSISGKSAVINREGLRDGIYFFHIVNEKGESAGGKFVVE
jgi:hypothetical protein